jgi:hypothetical protein
VATPPQIGNWSISIVPEGWKIVPDYGLRRTGAGLFPSNVVLTEEQLPQGMTLGRYIDNQIEIMKYSLPEPQIKGPAPVLLFGDEETYKLDVRYKSSDERLVVQLQIYTVASKSVGIATFTTVQEETSAVRDAFRAIGKGLTFAKGSPLNRH